jgi:hypothetical protein
MHEANGHYTARGQPDLHLQQFILTMAEIACITEGSDE